MRGRYETDQKVYSKTLSEAWKQKRLLKKLKMLKMLKKMLMMMLRMRLKMRKSEEPRRRGL